MKRKIIEIDEETCTGCGLCIPDCPEGALQVIDGKARLVSDLFCDGLGACIGTCPEGAITVVEREAAPYDEWAVMEKIAAQGEAVIRAHLEHLIGHGEEGLYRQALAYLRENEIPVPEHGVPPSGATVQRIARPQEEEQGEPAGQASELRQWPIQLRLINPVAASFDDADLLLSGDCVPFAYAGFHREFLRGRTAIILCPKLDADIEEYVAKLAAILSQYTIRSVTILHMEVPCCSGVRRILDAAMQRSGRAVPVREYTVTIDGRVVEGAVACRRPGRPA